MLIFTTLIRFCYGILRKSLPKNKRILPFVPELPAFIRSLKLNINIKISIHVFIFFAYFFKIKIYVKVKQKMLHHPSQKKYYIFLHLNLFRKFNVKLV